MRHRLFVHLVWTTRNRSPILTLPAVRFLSGYFVRIAEIEQCALIQFGAVQTHIHLLLRTHPSTAVSRVVQRMKGGSARIGARDHGLAIEWHPGYSADAVPEGGVSAVAGYVATQHRRHPTEAIPGWPHDPGNAEHRARRHVAKYLESLDREQFGGSNRGPRGGS